MCVSVPAIEPLVVNPTGVAPGTYTLSEVVPPDQLRDRAQELAEQIATQDPEVLADTKKQLWAALETA